MLPLVMKYSKGELTMRAVTAVEYVALDGVVEAPGRVQSSALVKSGGENVL